MLYLFACISFKASKLTAEQLERIEKNKQRAQELRLQFEKRMSQSNEFNSVVMNGNASVFAALTNDSSFSSKSFIQDEDSEKPEEHVDDMMDDNEALDFIFSSA